VDSMDDSSVQADIERLVEEEQELLAAGEGAGEDPEKHGRLEEIRVELDRCWDLLRQRRAREEFGNDPDRVSERDAGTVEGYEQ
jgi:Protein of unknown function (DUF2630)